jgi:hypothetical protein
MSRKSLPVDPDHQGTLLSLIGEDNTPVSFESFPNDGPQDKLLGRPVAYEVVYGPPESYKDVAERAEQLQAALGAFSLRNQRMGFAVASQTPRHNGPIFGRYRARVPLVQQGAERNTSYYVNEARINFWKATGFAAMRASGHFNEEQINARARNMWEKFSARYGTPVEDEDRKNYARRNFQRRLTRLIEMTKAIKLGKVTEQTAA